MRTAIATVLLMWATGCGPGVQTASTTAPVVNPPASTATSAPSTSSDDDEDTDGAAAADDDDDSGSATPSDDDSGSSSSSGGSGWFCHGSRSPDGMELSDCERSMDDCKSDKAIDDQSSAVASTTPCGPRDLAYCFGYVLPSGSHIDSCFTDSGHCDTMHEFTEQTAGDGDSSSARPGTVTGCEERR